MSQNLCIPDRIYSPGRDQTLFMGLSVMSFSASIGWNGQQSELTIQLVADLEDCENEKVYYNSLLSRQTMTGPDPGFTYPIIGSPHYFRVGDFEYMGLVQSYERRDAPDGKNIYTVKLVDPTEILAGTQLILSDYAGNVGGVANIINVYGFAESFGRRCPLTYVNGSPFGSPAGAFGGSHSNQNGMPWNIIQEAVSILTSSIPRNSNNFSPYGRLVFRGSGAEDSSYGGVRANQIDLEMPYIFEGHNGYLAHYFVDLSSLPVPPDYYRISGPNVTLLEAITQLCDDAGCDFYVELVPILLGGQILKIIKVRVAIRGSQPILGQIEAFIGDSSGLQSSATGLELRNETTSNLVVGEQQDNIYQANDEGNEDELYIEPFWGADDDGNVIEVQTEPTTGFEYVELDITQLNTMLHRPLPTTTINLYMLEIRAALAGQDSFEAITDYLGVGPPVIDANCFGAHIHTTIFEGGVGGPGTGWNSAFRVPDLIKGFLAFKPPAPGAAPGIIPGAGWAAWGPNKGRANIRSKDNRDPTEDLDTIYNFVADYARTYYGRQYMVKIPYSCVVREPDTEILQSTEVPTDSGWTEATKILGLNHPALTSIFSEDNGKTKCFAKFALNVETDTSPYDIEELRNEAFFTLNVEDEGNEGTSTEYLYISATAQRDIVYLNASRLYSPRVVINLSQPIHRRDNEENQFSPTQLMAWYFLVVVQGESSALVESFLTGATGIENSMMGLTRDAVQPLGVAIPMHSNVLTYGPWYQAGPPGKTNFEKDPGLAPWEYGSAVIMNIAGQSKVDTAVTYMQVSESGNLSVPGYPTFNLGAELMSGAGSLVETRGIITKTGNFPPDKVSNKGLWNANTNSPTIVDSVGTKGDYYTVSVAGNTTINGSSNWQIGDLVIFLDGAWRKQSSLSNIYINIDDFNNPRWSGIYGPNITNISCEVGTGGVSTLYSMRTYTPVSGRFSRLNAERLKFLGQKELQFRRAATLSAISNTIAFNAQHEDVKKKILKSLKTGRDSIKRGGTPVAVMAGGLIQNEGDQRVYADLGINKWTHIVNECSPDTYGNKAMMSLDGMFRPVSKAGSGGLPQYYANAFGLPFNIAPEPPVNAYTPMDVGLDDIDPLQAGHDVTLLARGTEIPDSGLCIPFDDTDDAEDYRFFAFKGPMIIQQFGFDLNNKPIPNEADNETNAKAGIFTVNGLKDSFMPDYLNKSQTWPVGPLDVRFDRIRGVWTFPTSYRIVTARLTSDLNYPASSTAIIIDGFPIEDASGSSASKLITVWPIGNKQNADTGDNVMAYYDTTDRKYKVIEAGGSTTTPPPPSTGEIHWGTVTGGTYPNRATYSAGVLLDAVQVIDLYTSQPVEVLLPKSADRIPSLYYGDLIAYTETIDGTFVCVSDYSVTDAIFYGTITSDSIPPNFADFNVSTQANGIVVNYTCTNLLAQPILKNQTGLFCREQNNTNYDNKCWLLQAEFACLCVVTDILIKDTNVTQNPGPSNGNDSILFKVSDRKIYLESAWTAEDEDSANLTVDLTVWCCSSNNENEEARTMIEFNLEGGPIEACKASSSNVTYTRTGCLS